MKQQRKQENSKTMHILALLFTILLVTSPVSQCSKQPLPILRPDDPLTTTLLQTYNDLRKAAEDSNLDSVIMMLDPIDANSLRAMTRKNGYNSLRSYLSNRMSGWPDPDTLSILEVTSNDKLARLTLAGMGNLVSSPSDRICYTGILFRRQPDGWSVAAITSIEKDRYDHFGQEMNFHETDYPPRFRFPRRF